MDKLLTKNVNTCLPEGWFILHQDKRTHTISRWCYFLKIGHNDWL